MKQVFNRFLFYLFITIIITGPFRSSWPDAAVSSPFTSKLEFYFINYGIGWGFWALLFLSVHETVRFLRRRKAIENLPTKELPVPDTNRLDGK